MAKTFEQLNQQGNEIKNETRIKQNTGFRVGTLFLDLIETVQSMPGIWIDLGISPNLDIVITAGRYFYADQSIYGNLLFVEDVSLGGRYQRQTRLLNGEWSTRRNFNTTSSWQEWQPTSGISDLGIFPTTIDMNATLDNLHSSGVYKVGLLSQGEKRVSTDTIIVADDSRLKDGDRIRTISQTKTSPVGIMERFRVAVNDDGFGAWSEWTPIGSGVEPIEKTIYNVSKASSRFDLSLSTAISLVPIDSRIVGQLITFASSPDKWHLYQFSSNDISKYNNVDLWDEVPGHTLNVIIGGKDMPADTSKDSLSYRNKVIALLDSYEGLPNDPTPMDRYCTLSAAPVISKIAVITIETNEVSKYLAFFIATGDTSELDTSEVYNLDDTFFVNLTGNRKFQFENAHLAYRHNKWVVTDKDNESIAYEPDEILDFGFLHSTDKSAWVFELLPPDGYSIYEYSLEGWKEFKLSAGDQFRVYGEEENEYYVNKEGELVRMAGNRPFNFQINESGSFYKKDMSIKVVGVDLSPEIASIVFNVGMNEYTNNEIVDVVILKATTVNFNLLFKTGFDRGSVDFIYEEAI